MVQSICKAMLFAAMTAVLVACGSRDRAPDLLNIRSNTDGPDEFAILPGKPLQSPENFSDLPEPTPGGSNITDPTPRQDAVAALGGRPELIQRSGQPGPDGSLLSHAARFGIATDIRQQIAAEDLEFRRTHRGRILERLFNVNRYSRAYEDQALDRRAELLRMRRLGIRTPAAPPDPVE